MKLISRPLNCYCQRQAGNTNCAGKGSIRQKQESSVWSRRCGFLPDSHGGFYRLNHLQVRLRWGEKGALVWFPAALWTVIFL